MQSPGRTLTGSTGDGADVHKHERSRNATIDLVKGLAITLVVVGHYYPADSPAWWTTLHNLIYAFHMPVFFFAAGYIWHLRAQETYGGYLIRKAGRLLVPCLSVIVLYLPVKLAASMFADLDHPVNAATLAKVVTDPAHSFLPFIWFIYVLFILDAIFPIACRWGPRAGWLSIAAAAVVYLRSENHYIVMTSIGYLYFAGGALLAQRLHLDLDKHIPGPAPEMALGCGILFVLTALLWKPGDGWSAQPRFFLVSVLGTMTTVLCCQAIVAGYHGRPRRQGSARRPIILASLMGIGASSMTIFLFHTLFTGAVKAGLHRFSLLEGLPFALKAFLCVLAGLVLPLAMEWAVFRRVGFLSILFLGQAKTTPGGDRVSLAAAWARFRALHGSPAHPQTRRLWRLTSHQ